MSTLKETQAAYREAIEALSKDPRQAPAAFRPGVIAQHNALQQRLPGLLAAFSNALHDQTYGFLPVGAESEAWAAQALKEASDGILVNTRGIYIDLASDRLWNSMDRHNRFFGPTQLSILDDELRGYGEKLTDEHIPFPDYINQAAIVTVTDLVDRIQAIMEKSFGLKYRILYIRKAITDAASKLDLKGTTVPVILTGAPLMNTAQELAQAVFLPNRWITVNTETLGGEEFIKTSVQKTFAEVKKSLSKKKSPSKETNHNE